jgi:hypothetical protein
LLTGAVLGASLPGVKKPAPVQRRDAVALADSLDSQKLAALTLPSPSPLPVEQQVAATYTYHYSAPRPCGPPACGYYGRLFIPTGHINAPLEYIGRDGCCNLGVPRNVWEAGLYGSGPMPGDPGTALIVGHNHWYSGPVLFWTLGQDVHLGDPITIMKNGGGSFNYRVGNIFSIPFNANFDQYHSDTGPSRILIITCSGVWDAGKHEYLNRTLISADLV